MTDEDKVKAKWPRAITTPHGFLSDHLIVVNPPKNPEVDGFWGKHLSSAFLNEDEAWADAARRLEEQ